jgi:hypothetical protein
MAIGTDTASVVGVRRATIATATRLDGTSWLILLAVTVGTNLLDFAAVPSAGGRPGLGFLLAALLRVALVFWVSYTLLRRLAGTARPHAVTIAFWRLALLQLAMLIVVGLATRLAFIMAGPNPPLATAWLAGFLGLAGAGLLTIRILAWHTALAVGAPFAALGALWLAQKDAAGRIALAFVALILPVAALHLALTLVGIRIPLAPLPHLLVAVVDGIVQAWQLALTLGLAVVAWQIGGSPGAAQVDADGRRG